MFCDSSTQSRQCGFLAIARELRDIIYTDLVTSGDVAILQVSRQVHDEAKELLYKQGICRLKLHYDPGLDHLQVLKSPQSPLHNVQNFNLKIVIREYGSCTRSLNSVGDQTSFVDKISRVNRDLQPSVHGSGNCHIILVLEDAGSTGHHYLPNPVYRLLESLSTFKLVTLRIHFPHIFHPMDRRNRDLVEPRVTKHFWPIATASSRALGHPEWKSDICPYFTYNQLPQPQPNPYPNAQYLEFHPRKYVDPKGGV